MVSGRQTNKEINKQTGRQTDLKILRNKHSVAEALVLWGQSRCQRDDFSITYQPRSSARLPSYHFKPYPQKPKRIDDQNYHKHAKIINMVFQPNPDTPRNICANH